MQQVLTELCCVLDCSPNGRMVTINSTTEGETLQTSRRMEKRKERSLLLSFLSFALPCRTRADASSAWFFWLFSSLFAESAAYPARVVLIIVAFGITNPVPMTGLLFIINQQGDGLAQVTQISGTSGLRRKAGLPLKFSTWNCPLSLWHCSLGPYGSLGRGFSFLDFLHWKFRIVFWFFHWNSPFGIPSGIPCFSPLFFSHYDLDFRPVTCYAVEILVFEAQQI